jgi:hypothetical protein
MKSALVVGSAPCVFDDFRQARANFPSWDLLVVNWAGLRHIEPIAGWFSIHRRLVYKAIPMRKAAGGDMRFTAFIKIPKGEKIQRPEAPTRIVPGKHKMGSGSSGLFAVENALHHLGYERLLLCGIPLEGDTSLQVNDKEEERSVATRPLNVGLDEKSVWRTGRMALRKRFHGEIEDIPSEIIYFEDALKLFGKNPDDGVGFIWMQPVEGAALWCFSEDRTSIVEIGRCEGGSTLLMGAAKSAYGRLVSLDIDPVDDDQVRKMLKRLCIPNVELLIEDSTKYPTDDIGGIDFLLIDGDHEYEGVKGDFDNWFPAVDVGGVIAFHDVHDRPGKTNAVGRFFHETLAKEKVEFIMRAGTLCFIRKVG